MKLNFQNCKFIVSSDGKHFPKQPGMHLVLLGRSNVGKSSLINHLWQKFQTRREKLAALISFQ